MTINIPKLEQYKQDDALATESGNDIIRVFTMNIWNFQGEYRERQRLLRSGIHSLNPDLIAFQEAGYDGNRHQVREMLDGLNYNIIHQFDGLTYLPGSDGCAIASRWPVRLLEVVSLQITDHSKGYPYAALISLVEAPKPVGPFIFVCAKPSWELNREYERELQAVELTKAIERHVDRADPPPIVAGDFDATPESASIRFLTGKQSLHGMSVHFRDAWEEAGDGTTGYTWTYKNDSARGVINNCFQDQRHERRIDYIFLGSPHDCNRRACVRDARVVLDTPDAGVWPSDHYAVYAQIEMCNPALNLAELTNNNCT